MSPPPTTSLKVTGFGDFPRKTLFLDPQNDPFLTPFLALLPTRACLCLSEHSAPGKGKANTGMNMPKTGLKRTSVFGPQKGPKKGSFWGLRPPSQGSPRGS